MAGKEFSPKVTMRGSNYKKFELRVFPGPQQWAVTGASDYNAIFGRQWLAVLNQDNSLETYQEDVIDGVWTLVQSTDIPASLPSDAKNLGAATQQDARFAICYEDGSGIHVSQFDAITNQYVVRGPYAGVDPVLYNDAQINGEIGNSDVTLFYLSVDRLNLNYRLQSENYGTEHTLFTSATPIMLDMVTAGGLRYALWISDANGNPLDFPLVSDLSDAIPHDFAYASMGPLTDGAMKLVVIVTTGSDIASASIGSLTDGEYAEPVQVYTASDSGAGSIGTLTDGVYFLAVIVASGSDVASGGIGALTDGLYYLAVIVRTPATDTVSAGVGCLTDGVYA